MASTTKRRRSRVPKAAAPVELPATGLVTIQLAAAYWNVSERTVYNLFDRGLEYVQVGRQKRIRVEIVRQGFQLPETNVLPLAL